jgi:hypothetical protein
VLQKYNLITFYIVMAGFVFASGIIFITLRTPQILYSPEDLMDEEHDNVHHHSTPESTPERRREDE